MMQLSMNLRVWAVGIGAFLSAPSVCADNIKFGVNPTVIRSSNCATLTLPTHHPAYLAVRSPNGHWIYIVDKSLGYSYFDNFQEKSTLTFCAGNLQGIEFVDGKRTTRKVFEDKGKYLFYVADNLETEPDNTFELDYSVTYLPN